MTDPLTASTIQPGDDLKGFDDPPTTFLTLAQVNRATDIPLITLSRYLSSYPDRFKDHIVGTGHKRRFRTSSFQVFADIKRENLEARKSGGRATADKSSTPAPMSGKRRGRPPGIPNKPKHNGAVIGKAPKATETRASVTAAVQKGRKHTSTGKSPSSLSPRADDATAIANRAILLAKLETLDDILGPLLEQREYLRGLVGVAS